MPELISKNASEIVTLLQAGEICVEDTLSALEERVKQVEPGINALPTLCFDRAREMARQEDHQGSLLAGIPVAIKDLTDVAGVHTTFGSMLHRDNIPLQSDVMVQRLEANGGIVYAKSNTPEFGTGGNTFNDVFGATQNPYDLARSAGGSSGGAAAALASGTAWLAQGSDLGGSLRTPASFCGVTSLRPSPGLVTTNPGLNPFDVYSQKGPMARNIADLALFADAIAGPSTRVGISKPRAGTRFREAIAEPVRPGKIAYSENLGVTETTAAVAAVCSNAITTLEKNGIAVADKHPDLSMAHDAFRVPRALDYAHSFGQNLAATRDILKPEIVWEVETGLSFSSDEIRNSMNAQGQVFTNASDFMQDYDLLICPAAILPPYPVDERYPGFSDGLEYAEYYRWLAICYAITVTTLPVITLPCGKTDHGLPVGLQLIGKPHGELELFAWASYIEQIFSWDPLQRIIT